MNIIFFGNDFGLGPTSRAHAIASEVKRLAPQFNVVLVCTELSSHNYPNSLPLIDVIADLRDPSLIQDYLDAYDSEDTVVVSVLNRFALSVAKRTKIKTVLIDGLFWFWNSRPPEYSNADYQVCIVLPWMLKNYQDNNKQFFFANPIARPEEQSRNLKTLSGHLVTVNGFFNPFYDPRQEVYLDVMATYAREVAGVAEGVLLCGSRFAIDRINSSQRNSSGVRMAALSKSEFIDRVYSSEAVHLNGGSNSFLEVLASSTPFIFSLPNNQSQYALMKQVAIYTGKAMEFWSPALQFLKRHEDVLGFKKEAEAMDYIASLIESNLNLLKNNMSTIVDKSLDNIQIMDQLEQVSRMRNLSAECFSATEKIAKKIVSISDRR